MLVAHSPVLRDTLVETFIYLFFFFIFIFFIIIFFFVCLFKRHITNSYTISDIQNFNGTQKKD